MQSELLVTHPNPATLCKEISNKNLVASFPNVDTALRMFLCMPIANCSGERSFSVLKRVKNYLRATIDQQRMDSLSVLSIECELMKSLDHDDVIASFADCKARRKIL